MSHWSRKLKAIGACEEAVEWAADQPDFPTAWQACERADWLLWLAGKMADRPGWPERKAVNLAGIACGRLSLEHAGKWRKELEEVFDVAERCANDPTPENRSAAESAAESAAWFAARSDAWFAARSAAWFDAESDAWSSAESDAWSDAWFSARSAARSAWSAAWSAWSAAHKTMCGIIRERITPGNL